MPGLYECPKCHYRFETHEDLADHVEGGCDGR